MTILVFSSKALADSTLKSLGETPYGSVFVWMNPDNIGGNDIQYLTSQDGRVAVAHPFTDQDRAWLADQLRGVDGAQMLDDLPADWQYPQET